jgi:hypothetical protein
MKGFLSYQKIMNILYKPVRKFRNEKQLLCSKNCLRLFFFTKEMGEVIETTRASIRAEDARVGMQIVIPAGTVFWQESEGVFCRERLQ